MKKKYYVEIGYNAFRTGSFKSEHYNTFIKLCEEFCREKSEEFYQGKNEGKQLLAVRVLDIWNEENVDESGTILVKIYPETVLKTTPCGLSSKITEYKKWDGKRSWYLGDGREFLADIEILAKEVADEDVPPSTAEVPLKNKHKGKSQSDKPKRTRKKRGSKFEDAADEYLRNLVDAVKRGEQTQAFALNLSSWDIAEVLIKKDKFKKYKKHGVEHNTELLSVNEGVRRSEAWETWQKQKKALIGGTRPPSLEETYDKRTHPDTKLPHGVHAVDCDREEYEAPVEEFLQALHNQFLCEKITQAKYLSIVAELTTEAVAAWIKKNKPAFKGRSIVTISDGVRDSTAWINRAKILNVDAYKNG